MSSAIDPVSYTHLDVYKRQDFKFVRVDLYDVDGKPFFGEMTFTPAGGFDVSQCRINGQSMGELLKI